MIVIESIRETTCNIMYPLEIPLFSKIIKLWTYVALSNAWKAICSDVMWDNAWKAICETWNWKETS